MKKIISISILFVLFIFSVMYAENEAYYQQKLTEGNKLYSENKFIEAKTLFLEVVNANYESASLFYNLGNTYYKLNDIAHSILYFEKAKKINPGDVDVLFNLEIANQRITDKIEPLPELFLTKLWYGFIHSQSADGWGKWTLVLIFWSALSIALYLFSFSLIWRKLFFYNGIISFAIAVVTLFFAFTQDKLSTEANQAIVFTPTLTVKSSPEASGTNLFVIHEGTKVKIVETVNDWYKIVLLDGNIGWLKKSDVKTI